jgi:hypothetical protein
VVDSCCVVYRGKGADLTMPKLKEGAQLLNMGLDESKVVFQSGAEEKLVEMGFLRLGKMEARAILQSRMELDD